MFIKLQNGEKNLNPIFRDLVLGLVCALFFSAFIYLEHFGFTLKIINTLFGLSALTMLLYMPKRAILMAGFFIGLFWFYWIGYSFKYNGVGFLEPLITLIFAIVYMLFFGVLALTNSTLLRAGLLFVLSFVEPADFNWLQIELLFVDSYLGIFKYQLFAILLALALPSVIKQKKYKYAPLLLLLAAINWGTPLTKEAPLKIKLVATDITQDQKWQKENLQATVSMVFTEIHKAREEKYDIVVLPESVFPFYMNKAPLVLEELKKLSHDISIVAGTLLSEGGVHYNVTYMFENGNYEIAKKLVLVPFGEYIPLPGFAKKVVNEYFFAGASDFKTASSPTDFTIKGVKFRNAICYEATCEELYEGDVDFMIASSNNAWFSPSIEPTIQKLLMRYYARKNNVTIYHAANWKGSGVVK